LVILARVATTESPTIEKLTPALRKRMRTTTVGERIRWARRRLDGGACSQEELARLLGSSRRHVIRLEKGRQQGGQNPGPDMRARLAAALGLPTAFFIDDETRR
jgi:transcriptional regulator with XRE-family HTH domain